MADIQDSKHVVQDLRARFDVDEDGNTMTISIDDPTHLPFNVRVQLELTKIKALKGRETYCVKPTGAPQMPLAVCPSRMEASVDSLGIVRIHDAANPGVWFEVPIPAKLI